MKKQAVVILAGAVVLGLAATAVAGPFTRREPKQQARIAQGARSGEIYPGEYRRLQHEQTTIEEYRRYAWSDGRLMPWEAGRLTFEQNRAGHPVRTAQSILC
jgi:hypothetical protein